MPIQESFEHVYWSVEESFALYFESFLKLMCPLGLSLSKLESWEKSVHSS